MPVDGLPKSSYLEVNPGSKIESLYFEEIPGPLSPTRNSTKIDGLY